MGDSKEKLRVVCTKFLQNVHGMDHHVHPYNELIDKTLGEIIHQQCQASCVFESDDRKFEVALSSSNYRTDCSETHAPADCFASFQTYAFKILVDFSVTVDGATTEHKALTLCHFPLMVGSGVCASRPGPSHGCQAFPGVFIMRGKCRFIPMCNNLVSNIPFRFLTRDGDHYIHIRSRHPHRPYRSTSTLEIRCNHVKTRSVLYYQIVLKIPFLTPYVPLGIVIKAMGGCVVDFTMELRKALSNHSRFESYISAVLDIGSSFDQKSAQAHLVHLYGHPVEIEKQLRQEVLPHVGPSFPAKIAHFVLYVKDLLMFREALLPQSDRDDYNLIRVQSSADLLAGLFRVQLQKHMALAVKMLRKQLLHNGTFSTDSALLHTRLTRAIFTAMNTGAFSKKRLGVSQQLNVMNKYAIISQLRRVSSSSLTSAGQRRKPRQVHPSQWGLICAAETPEGEQCGLVQSLALFATLSHGVSADVVTRILLEPLQHLVTPTPPVDRDVVYTILDSNGCIAGYIATPIAIYQQLLIAWDEKKISPQVTLSLDHSAKVVWIQCDKGRLIRPVAVKARVLATGVPGDMSLSSILESGMVRYISSACLEAVSSTWMDESANLTELSPIGFLGVGAALSPLFRHNQGPRLAYWIGMMKQIITADPPRDMGEPTSHHLHYGQFPLVATRAAKMLGVDKQKDGVNVVVMFYPHPYNQEDAIVINRASVERGLFLSSAIKTHQHEITATSNVKFSNPHLSNATGLQDAAYSHLSESGLPSVGAYLGRNDIVLGKTQTLKKPAVRSNKRKKRDMSSDMEPVEQDMSVRLKGHEEGEVIAATVSTTMDRKVASVVVAQHLVPQVGDKLSSRHSQKGTIGILEDPENLPFNQYGMCPDVIVSPLGLTSRMTIGVILECILGKTAAIAADLELGTDEQDLDVPFDTARAHLQRVLKEHGFSANGTERFTDGRTGEPIKAAVLSGCVYYTKLNHMISRKSFARGPTGPVDILTKQPKQGRKNHGGLKFGQMESECLQAHATAEILRERFCTASDAFDVPLCTLCGRIAICNDKLQYSFCRQCNETGSARRVKIGYTTKLMTQELQATGIDVRLAVNQPR